MINKSLVYSYILFTLLFSPLGKAEQEPEVDVERADALLHCSIMAKQSGLATYRCHLPLRLINRVNTLKKLPSVTNVQPRYVPSLIRPKENSAIYKPTWIIVLACSGMNRKPQKSEKNSMSSSDFTMKKWLNNNSSATD